MHCTRQRIPTFRREAKLTNVKFYQLEIYTRSDAVIVLTPYNVPAHVAVEVGNYQTTQSAEINK